MAAFEASGTDRIKLISQEGDAFEVSLAVAKMSPFIMTMVSSEDEDGGDDAAKEVPLPNVTAPILAKVVEYCSHYVEEKMTEFEKARNK